MSLGESKNNRILAIAGAVFALILLLLYMQGSFVSKVEPGSSPLPNEKTPDHTVQVESRQVDELLSWPGTVKSRIVANIAPKTTARIIEIKVNAGDKVKKGDVIARLDERDVKAQAGAAAAALASANAQASRALADERRTRGLYEKEAATRESFDAAVARAKETQAAVAQANSAVTETKSHLADTTLLAPFDGVIAKRLQEPGDMGLPGVPVATLQTTLGLRFEVGVPNTCAGRYKIDDNVNVRIDTIHQTLNAQIDEISPEIDPQTRTQLVKAALPTTEGLQPGYFGWLEQACGGHEALLIPADAVQHIGQLEVVGVVVQGRQAMRHVRTGKIYGDQIEVISGLHAGETVVTHPAREQ
ncbi:MAG: efflux RND transporter periplasmic adaptor subunit [Methylobacter sp.]